MKIMAEWLEMAIANVEVKKSSSVLLLIILAVLGVTAISLYVLLNSPA